MDEPLKTSPGGEYRRFWPGRWPDARALPLLLLLAVLLRVWGLDATPTPARDCITYIQYARQLEQRPWAEVVRGQAHHPGFPASVLAVSWPVRWWCGGVDSYALQLSAQLASSLAGLLLVFPMYYLGKRLGGTAVGFWAALWFQALPSAATVMADGVSDPLYLLFATAALYAAVRAADGSDWRRYALCGFLGGLAYLTRPEGALVVLVAGAALVGFQLVPKWRRDWGSLLKCGAALGLAGLLTGSPYYLTTGGFSNKPSTRQLRGAPVAARPAAGGAAGGALFATHIDRDGGLGRRVVRATRAYGVEVGNAFFFFGWVPALLALAWCRRMYHDTPGIWVGASLFCLHAALAWWLVFVAGYVSERHALFMVVCTIFPAAAALLEAPGRLWGYLDRGARAGAAWARCRAALTSRAAALVLPCLIIGAGLTRYARPFHQTRMGYQQAGAWLAEHAGPADVVEDDHDWAEYYAGRQAGPPSIAPAPGGRRYVVVNRSSHREFVVNADAAKEGELVRQGAQVVYHWPEEKPADDAMLLIYEVQVPPSY